MGPLFLDAIDSIAASAVDIAYSLGDDKPVESIAQALTRLANAVEAQTAAQERMTAELASAIGSIACRIEDCMPLIGGRCRHD
jgi:GTP cyclohydrolase I